MVRETTRVPNTAFLIEVGMSNFPNILDIMSWDTHQALEHGRGYQAGREDVFHSRLLMTFTREHSRTFRLGYCQAWAEEKTAILLDKLQKGICGQSNAYANALAESEFAKIWEETSKLAECPDDEVTDY
jgi:hypothetical protein